MPRATRSSVRAGTARLENQRSSSPRTTRASKKRSASVTTASSNDELDTPVVETMLDTQNHQTRQLQDQTHKIHALEQRELEAAHRISELVHQRPVANANPVDHERHAFSYTPRSERRRPRDIRRHFSIEVPTQQKLLQEAAEATLNAKSSRISSKLSDRSEKRLITHNTSVADTDRDSQSAFNKQTDVAESFGSPQQVPSHESPYSWNFSSIFDSVKKVFGSSPSKLAPSREQSTDSPNGLSPIQEESPSAGRSKQRDAVNQSQTDDDLSRIVRKRKASIAPASSNAKKPKVDGPSFAVPSESDSEENSTQHHQVASRRVNSHTSSRDNTTSRRREHDPATDVHLTPHMSSKVSATPRTHRVTSPEKTVSKDKSTVRRRRSPGRRPVKPMAASTEPESRKDNANGQDRDTTMHDVQTPTHDSQTVETPTSRRRTARTTRERRETVNGLQENGKSSNMGSQQHTAVARPHYFEIKDYDQYTTAEAAEAAVDAMLAIEDAEEKRLPMPQTSATPAERILPKAINFMPSTLKNTGTPRSISSSSLPKPREPNADKREEQVKSREAERQRLLKRARELKEEQRKMEEELKKYETAEEDEHDVGKKRKRINVDELSIIPSRRPGQSGGTFALLDEFFDCDGSEIEIDESQADLLTARPSKKARTESNVFDSVATDKSSAAALGSLPSTELVSGMSPVVPSAKQTANHSVPTTNYMSQALQRKRSEVEKYKPKQSSTLREVSHLSPASSARGSATPAQPNVAEPVSTNPLFTAKPPEPAPASEPAQASPQPEPTHTPNATDNAVQKQAQKQTQRQHVDWAAYDTDKILTSDVIAFLNEEPEEPGFFVDWPVPDLVQECSEEDDRHDPERDARNLARFRAELEIFIAEEAAAPAAPTSVAA